MAFHGKNSRLLLGTAEFSGYLSGFESGDEVELADVTVFGDEGHKYLAGLEQGTLSLDGKMDNDALTGGQDETLNSLLRSAVGSIITAAPGGLAVGARVRMIEARKTNYAVSAPVGDAVSFSSSWQSEGQVDQGVSLHDVTAEEASTNGASVDGGALSEGGACGYLHVTENTRDTATTVAVQHSADDETFVDLITFTSVGAATTVAERVAVTGTVNQYLRAATTLAEGTGSITLAIAAARR